MILPATYQNGFAPRDGQPLYPSLWTGCVGAWNPGLGPSGLTLRDNSGLGNHGTLINGPTWVASQGRYAMSFDGTNDHVTTLKTPTSKINNWTISAWINPAALPTISTARIAVSHGYDDGISIGNGYAFGVGQGSGAAGSQLLGLLPGVIWISTGYTFPLANAWYHVIMCRRNGTIEFHVNGTKTTLTSTSTPVTPTELRIGGQFSGRYFPGQIDGIAVHERAIDASEIRTLSTRRGIAYEMAPRRRSSVQVTTNRRRRIIIGGNR